MNTVRSPFNFRTLDLNLLRIFDAVMSEGSLTRAAEQLALTQPAVSNALRRLREAVGEDLLVRTARGVRPTAFASAVWPEVRQALAALRTALGPDSFDPAVDTAHFVLALADATAAVLLPPLMAGFERGGWHTTLKVLPLVSGDPRPLLQDGAVDVAVGHFPEVVPALLREGDQALFGHWHLAASEYMCVMRVGHPLSQGPLTLDAYCAARHVRISFSGEGRSHVDQALAALQRTRTIALTVNQFFSAARVVARTDLLTVMPRGFLPPTGEDEPLVVRPLPFASAGIHLDALWHRRHDSRASQRWLRERLALAADGLNSHSAL